MASSGRVPLTLKQFMLRQEVLKLYRTFFRTVRLLPKDQQADVSFWIRTDFKNHKNIDVNDEERIKAMLYHGQKMLNELKNSVDFSKA